MSQRYALLVGIDYYLNDGTRKFDHGGKVRLSHLRGCVHDVKAIEKVLLDQYKMSPSNITVLSSSQPDSSLDDKVVNSVQPTEPIESKDRLPTFDKIKRKFRSISDKANSGDFFFFHFSGHGARLPRLLESPRDHVVDASLLTVDFCLGKPAVRGWELNEWLKELNEKGVHIVVSLDSCHSGNAWRSDGSDAGYRTPGDWDGEVMNLPTDNTTTSVTIDQPEYRYAELQISWSLNPKNFTLMTACGDDQRTAEQVRNGKTGGKFTHCLLAYLKKNKYHVTYRMIFEHLKLELKDQSPEVHGCDRFLFFGTSEPFFVTSLKVQGEGERIHIPAGRRHGVQRGSEFVPFPLGSYRTITVDRLQEFTSSAKISEETRTILRQHDDTIVPSRWCLAEGSVLRVIIDEEFEPAFQEALRKSLVRHIASAIQITRAGESADAAIPEGTVSFNLRRGDDDGIRVYGPKTVIGYTGPVQPLKIGRHDGYSTVEKLAAEVATPLVHLSRFGHILGLNSGTSSLFEASVLPKEGKKKESYTVDQSFVCSITNTSDRPLFLAVFNLTPEFGIQQIWPNNDTTKMMAPSENTKLPSFALKMPSAPHGIESLLQRNSRREIIRTLATTQDVSWKTLEMPNIWEADRVHIPEISDERGVVFDSTEVQWSVVDNCIKIDK